MEEVPGRLEAERRIFTLVGWSYIREALQALPRYYYPPSRPFPLRRDLHFGIIPISGCRVIRFEPGLQLRPRPSRINSVMKNELIKAVFVVGLSLGLARAQEGVTAIGGALSKEGLRVVSLRTALGGNPYLNLGVQAGKDLNAWTVGISLSQFLIYSPCKAACRRTAPVAPYLDFGLRLHHTPEASQTTAIGHAGAGVLFPIGFVELFGQANLYANISQPKPQFDILGGLRIRF